MKCFNIRGTYVPATAILHFKHGKDGHWANLWTITLVNGTVFEVQVGANTEYNKPNNELLADMKEYFGIE